MAESDRFERDTSGQVSLTLGRRGEAAEWQASDGTLLGACSGQCKACDFTM